MTTEQPNLKAVPGMSEDEALAQVRVEVSEYLGSPDKETAGAIYDALADDLLSAVSYCMAAGQAAGSTVPGLDLRVAVRGVLEKHRGIIEAHRSLDRRRDLERQEFLRAGGSPADFQEHWSKTRREIVEHRTSSHAERMAMCARTW